MDKYSAIGSGQIEVIATVKEVKIEIKKLKIDTRLSQETIAFTADLYVNGELVGMALNRGHGGPTMIECMNKNSSMLYNMAKTYVASLPEKDYGDFKHKMDLYDYVDELVAKEDERKQLDKHMKKGIVVGIPGSPEFSIFKLRQPVSSYNVESMNVILAQIKPKLKAGEVILNNNLPA